VTPIQVSRFQREQRYQILPAYTQDGVILAHIFQGSTDSTVFEDFVEQLLPLCGKWLEPKSVFVMDNASFHHTKRIKEMCHDAGVKLVYLLPYSPDLNQACWQSILIDKASIDIAIAKPARIDIDIDKRAAPAHRCAL
jgi:transposase